jgi:riboflavin kinase
LKFLALQGGTRHPVHISSIRLSKNLGISQQSASRYLIELVDEGFVDRRLAQGGQIVTILEKGIVILKKEFSEYSLMFGIQREIEMKGTLETGLGEGGYYISKKGYMHQFKEKLGWEPFEGTFNLRLNEDEIPKMEAMRAAEGMLINGFEQEGRTFGKAWVFECTLKTEVEIIEDCAIISPKRTHYKRVVEVISPIFLRQKFNAKDGDIFTICVNLGDI